MARGGWFFPLFSLELFFAMSETPEYFYFAVIILDLLAMAIFAYSMFLIGNILQSLVASVFFMPYNTTWVGVFDYLEFFVPAYICRVDIFYCIKLVFEKSMGLAAWYIYSLIGIEISFIFYLCCGVFIDMLGE